MVFTASITPFSRPQTGEIGNFIFPETARYSSGPHPAVVDARRRFWLNSFSRECSKDPSLKYYAVLRTVRAHKTQDAR